MYFNRRPDEEGIKTRQGIPQSRISSISTADLMKKGLRPGSSSDILSLNDFNRRPDEEGIKTVRFGHVYIWRVISTADLMKKGLRHSLVAGEAQDIIFQPQT